MAEKRFEVFMLIGWRDDFQPPVVVCHSHVAVVAQFRQQAFVPFPAYVLKEQHASGRHVRDCVFNGFDPLSWRGPHCNYLQVNWPGKSLSTLPRPCDFNFYELVRPAYTEPN